CRPFFCPFLLFPLRGSIFLIHPTSFVPHGAGPSASVVFVLCAHPIPEQIQKASPP
uniref:Uncharacterized protein n=1 Tax=Saimiri boliviensis boliviensis TaxID=39432 RepID=A0A2K6V874_SAIBB